MNEWYVINVFILFVIVVIMNLSKTDLNDSCIIKVISTCYKDVDAEVLQYDSENDNEFIEVKRC